MSVHLYGRNSPNTLKAKLALEEFGFDYDFSQLDDSFSSTRTDPAGAPCHKYPALYDCADDKRHLLAVGAAEIIELVADSGAMPEYMDARVPATDYLPKVYWYRNEREVKVLPDLVQSMCHEMPETIIQIMDEIRFHLRDLEQQLGHGKRFFCGGYSPADIALYPWVATVFQAVWFRCRPLLAEFPRLKQWARLMSKRPVVRKVMHDQPGDWLAVFNIKTIAVKDLGRETARLKRA